MSTRDSSLDIFLVRGRAGGGYALQSKCEGHSAAVRHLDWSEDSSVLSSDGADYELLYWDARTGRQNLDSQMDTGWATWTRVLGFPVMGIWPPGSDGTDVNACDRSPDGDFAVTADDEEPGEAVRLPRRRRGRRAPNVPRPLFARDVRAVLARRGAGDFLVGTGQVRVPVPRLAGGGPGAETADAGEAVLPLDACRWTPS